MLFSPNGLEWHCLLIIFFEHEYLDLSCKSLVALHDYSKSSGFFNFFLEVIFFGFSLYKYQILFLLKIVRFFLIFSLLDFYE